MSILFKAAVRQAVLIGIKWKASNGFSWDILKANWFWPIFYLCSLQPRSESKTSPELCSADTLVLFASVEPRQSIPNLAVKLWRSWQTCWKSSRKHQLSARVIFFLSFACFAVRSLDKVPACFCNFVAELCCGRDFVPPLPKGGGGGEWTQTGECE